MRITQGVLDLFLKHEGLNQPGRVPPLDTSGVTIGIGYDLGQCSREQFTRDWGAILRKDHYDRLRSVVGLRGKQAEGAAYGLRDIVISRDDAMKVLSKCLDQYGVLTLRAFPGLEKYHPDVQGAVLSLVYNRGAGMGDALKLFDGRQEMRDLKALILRGAECEEIAEKIDNMAHLWQDMGADGLITRRHEEAELIRAADDPPGLAA